MTEIRFVPIILAGGKGERFWPLSRLNRPKQFLCLDGSGNTLLQETAQRLLSLAGGWEGLMVITSELLAERVRQQLPHLPQDNILLEPMGRDTAPAVAWASLEVKRRYGDNPNLIVGFFPADHHIGNPPSLPASSRRLSTLLPPPRALLPLASNHIILPPVMAT